MCEGSLHNVEAKEVINQEQLENIELELLLADLDDSDIETFPTIPAPAGYDDPMIKMMFDNLLGNGTLFSSLKRGGEPNLADDIKKIKIETSEISNLPIFTTSTSYSQGRYVKRNEFVLNQRRRCRSLFEKCQRASSRVRCTSRIYKSTPNPTSQLRKKKNIDESVPKIPKKRTSSAAASLVTKSKRKPCWTKEPSKIRNIGRFKNTEKYYFEKVFDFKQCKTTPLFLIKWHGWSEDYNSWEPQSSFDCGRDPVYIQQRKLWINQLNDIATINPTQPKIALGKTIFDN